MKKKTLIEMGEVNKEYIPQKRVKSILQKEREALMDTDVEPLSYSIIDYQPGYRDYKRVDPGDEKPGDNNDAP